MNYDLLNDPNNTLSHPVYDRLKDQWAIKLISLEGECIATSWFASKEKATEVYSNLTVNSLSYHTTKLDSTMETTKTTKVASNEITLSGNISKITEREYGEGKKQYGVDIAINYVALNGEKKAEFFSAQVPDKHKDQMKELVVGNHVKLTGFISNDSFLSKDDKKISTDKIIVTKIEASEKKEQELNYIKFSGLAGSDAVVKQVGEGKKVAEVSLAHKIGEDTLWKKVSAWGDKADSLSAIKKGDLVHVEGNISVNKFETDKSKTSSFEITAVKVQKLEKNIEKKTEVAQEPVVKKIKTPDISR